MLRDEMQCNVYCIAWKPLSGNTLAVGCEYVFPLQKVCVTIQGMVCVFGQYPLKSNKKEENIKVWFHHLKVNCSTGTWVTLLRPDIPYFPVQTMCWSNDGRLLATGSKASSSLIIWDVALKVPTVIRSLGTHGTSLLSWSPDGLRLFAATT